MERKLCVSGLTRVCQWSEISGFNDPGLSFSFQLCDYLKDLFNVVSLMYCSHNKSCSPVMFIGQAISSDD